MNVSLQWLSDHVDFSDHSAVLYRHVLVVPKRVCTRVADLSSDEVADLFASVV